MASVGLMLATYASGTTIRSIWKIRQELALAMPNVNPGHIMALAGIFASLLAFGLGVIIGKHFQEKKENVNSKSSANATETEIEWLLPLEAAERFAPADKVKEWKDSPQYLEEALRKGILIARGTPHYGTAGDEAKIIDRAEWQSLKLVGHSAVSSSMHSYDNLSITKTINNITKEK
jgi:hypothetical protein